jgi:DNA-binding response OmpR family regulator
MGEIPTKTVAIFNASHDIVELLKVLFSEHGWRAISGHADDVKSGALDFMAFLETHKPDAIVWDIAPPYDRNWRFFKLLRSVGPLESCTLVLTTTHKRHLDDLAGRETGAFEILGKPYDIQLIVDAVMRDVGLRAKAGPRFVAQT